MERRLIALAAVTAAAFTAFTACTEEIPLHDAQTSHAGADGTISFRALTTKAASIDRDNLRDFRIAANSEEPASGQGATPGDFNRFQALDVLNKGGRWDYAPAVYWPQDANAHVYFYAYSPAGSVNVTDFSFNPTSATDSAMVQYIVPLTATGGKQPEDFLVAKKAQSKQVGGTTVSLDFQHALSMVKFAARNKHPEATYIVKKIELLNLANEGSLNFAPLAEKDSRDSTYWALTGTNDKTYEPSLPANGIGLAPGSSSFKQLTSANEGMPVLPQRVEAQDTATTPLTDALPALRVTFEATGANGQVLIPETQQLFPFPATHRQDSLGAGKATWPAIADGEFVFQMGKRYTFNFTFGAGAIDRIVFDVNSVAGWDDVDTKAVGIWNEADLRAFKDSVEKGSYERWKDAQGVVNLRADIDLQGDTLSAIGQPAGRVYTKVFSGEFNGNGYAIRNVRFIEKMPSAGDAAYIGLFSILCDATIQNLRVEATLEATQQLSLPNIGQSQAGGIAAFSSVSGTGKNCILKNCTFSGKILDTNNQIWYSGGIVGSLGRNSKLEDCAVENAQIQAKAQEPSGQTKAAAGGLIGVMVGGESTACSVVDTEIESTIAGALAGQIGSNTTMLACYAATSNWQSPAKINGSSSVGGLFGASVNTITVSLTGCYNAIEMNASQSVGYLVGNNTATVSADGCYGLAKDGSVGNVGIANGGTINPTDCAAFIGLSAQDGLQTFYTSSNDYITKMNAAIAGAGYIYEDPSGNGSEYPVLRKP
jgi:hypothetical protein